MIDSSLREWIESELSEFEIPGASVALVEPGRESLFSFGVRRAGNAAPVDPDTAFSLASCSKAFTAFGIAILVDRGVLGFDDPVRKYIPEFTLDTPGLTETATLRDLLGMRLGLKPLGACHWLRSRGLSHADMLSRLQFLPRIAPFREGFVYLNPAYSALAEIISRTSGSRFVNFMATDLFGPLGMSNTFIDEGAVSDQFNIAIPHVKTSEGMTSLSAPRCGGREGESCQYISAADYLPWLNLNLRGALPNGRRLIAAGVQAELLTIQMSIAMPTGEAGYCMGWMRGVVDGEVVLSHEGGELGASTFAILCPREKIGVAVLLSRRSAVCVRSLAYGLLDRLRGGALPDRKREFLELDRMESEAAVAEIERSFALEASQPAPDLDAAVGTYSSPHSGLLKLSREGKSLRAAFVDIEACGCRLSPLGGEIFLVTDYDEPGLQQEVRGQMRARVASRDGRVSQVEFPGIGSFARTETGLLSAAPVRTHSAAR
jgi:CubicO group peptidase (beta-lactamase class C family)